MFWWLILTPFPVEVTSFFFFPQLMVVCWFDVKNLSHFCGRIKHITTGPPSNHYSHYSTEAVKDNVQKNSHIYQIPERQVRSSNGKVPAARSVSQPRLWCGQYIVVSYINFTHNWPSDRFHECLVHKLLFRRSLGGGMAMRTFENSIPGCELLNFSWMSAKCHLFWLFIERGQDDIFRDNIWYKSDWRIVYWKFWNISDVFCGVTAALKYGR